MPNVDASDGARIFYTVEGDGPALLLLQGVGVAGSAWAPQVAALRDRFRCISVDNRGIGDSTLGSHPVSIVRMADDALRVLDHAEVEAAHVAGHSMGGLISLQLALEHRARLRSLALLCTFADGPEFSRLRPWLVWTGIRTSIGTRRMRRHAFVDLVTSVAEREEQGHEALAERIGAEFGRDLADSPKVTMQQARAIGKFDASPRLAELEGLRTLVLSASEDRIGSPVRGRRLAEGIPGARFEELSGTSHACPITRAAEVNRLLLEHLGK